MKYLEWVEGIKKDFKDDDKERDRVIEAMKKYKFETLCKFHKNSRYGKFVKKEGFI